MKRSVALNFTVDLIEELNCRNYNLDNFDRDSKALMKLLKFLNLEHLEDNLDNVKNICSSELKKFHKNEDSITLADKKGILRYL